MTFTFTIDGRMPGLNDFIRKVNANRRAGNAMKQRETNRARDAAIVAGAGQGGAPIFFRPVRVSFLWVEPNRRRDIDNIAFAKKFILDGLRRAGVIADDSARCVVGFSDSFAYDKERPRIVVTVTDEVAA